MSYRITDEIVKKVRKALEDLEVLEAEKERIGWDVTFSMMPSQTGFKPAWLVAVSVPVGENHVLNMLPVDAHVPQEHVTLFVKNLYDRSQADADKVRAGGNGEGGRLLQG